MVIINPTVRNSSWRYTFGHYEREKEEKKKREKGLFHRSGGV